MTIFSNREFLKEVRRRPNDFYIIQYSCESLYDDNEGLSPRITSIAINHLATQQTVSFSTHAIAEELSIDRADVVARFAEIELELLKNFYSFARDRRDKFWVHWNMRNLAFGFEHIEHRFRTLGERDAPVIPVERRINLNDIIADRYGDNYAEDPKMQSLMDANGGVHRHFLTGKEEVNAFENAEFIKMHNSTLCKVGFFHKVIERMSRGTLQTASKGWGVALDQIFESRLAKAIGLCATLLTIALGLYELVKALI